MRRPVHVPAHQRFARLRPEQRQGAVEELDELRPLELELEPLVGDELGRLRREPQLQLASACPRPAEAHVARDRGEPAVGTRRVGELVGVAPRLQQRLLREVLGRLAVPGEVCAQTDQPPAIGLAPTPSLH
jgi:hypothetical protein